MFKTKFTNLQLTNLSARVHLWPWVAHDIKLIWLEEVSFSKRMSCALHSPFPSPPPFLHLPVG